jgi:hypothetical protein
MPKQKITNVTQKEYSSEDFKPPAKWYFVNALGDRVYIHCRERSKAIEYVKKEYDGKYSIRTEGSDKSGGELSCRGHVNSISRKGFRQKSID